MASICIIGGGPAGLSAAIYALRSGHSATVFYKDDGALAKADKIENYFGFSEPITGKNLLEDGRAQAARLGASLINAEVTGMEYAEKGFFVKTINETYAADAVILATGAPRAVPNIKNIKEFEGKGVSYCAICDAFFYRGKDIAVLGEGEYALEEIKTLLPVASSVTLLTNGKSAPDKLPENVKVDARIISEITGEEAVSSVSFQQGEPLSVSGIFIAYGTAGSAEFARKLGATLEGNRIKTDAENKTAVPGLFAAGDCTSGLLQVAKAVSDGAIAAMSAVKFLRG